MLMINHVNISTANFQVMVSIFIQKRREGHATGGKHNILHVFMRRLVHGFRATVPGDMVQSRYKIKLPPPPLFLILTRGQHSMDFSLNYDPP